MSLKVGSSPPSASRPPRRGGDRFVLQSDIIELVEDSSDEDERKLPAFISKRKALEVVDLSNDDADNDDDDGVVYSPINSLSTFQQTSVRKRQDDHSLAMGVQEDWNEKSDSSFERNKKQRKYNPTYAATASNDFISNGDAANGVESDYELALRIQEQESKDLENHKDEDDFALALQFEEEERNKLKYEEQEKYKRSEKDRSLALQLHTDEEVKHKIATEEEERNMYMSRCGQAWKLVEKILAMHDDFCGHQGSLATANGAGSDATSSFLSVIAVDDMVFMAERFLEKLHAFHARNTSVALGAQTAHASEAQWDLGYHYTQSKNIEQIRTNGLLSKAERAKHEIKEVQYNGSVYGDGIYAASNPMAFRNQKYGDIGVLVVRLQGTKQREANSGASMAGQMREFDSTIVSRGSSTEFVVLPTAGQCLPVFTFMGSKLTESNNAGILEKYATALETLLTEFFNDALGVILTAKPPTNAISKTGPA